MIELKPFQHEGVAFLCNNKYALLADDMGLGKTIQAIEALGYVKPGKAIIVCPKNTAKQWLKEIQKFRDPWVVQWIKSSSDKIKSAHIFIMSYGIAVEVKHKFLKSSVDALIFDEAHYLKSIYSQRTQAAFGDMGLVRKAKRVWLLTGTPIENTPIDLYPMLVTLAPQLIEPYTNYYDFAKRFCDGRTVKRRVRGRTIPTFYDKGVSHREELKKRLGGFMLRRLKEEVVSQLPLLRTMTIEHEADTVTREIMEEFNLLKTEQKYYFTELGIRSSVRQRLALYKVQKSLEYIEADLESVSKLIVYAHHKKVIEELQKALQKYHPVTITGETNKRYDIVTDFVEGRSRILIGSITAMGIGIDRLQKASSVMHLIEWDDTPGKTNQAIDRLHRMGQEDPVYAKFHVVQDSLESKMLKALLRKESDASYLVGDKKG